MTRHACRKDINHNPIEQIFRTMLADHVTDTSKFGAGAGDLFVSFGTYACFVEIKSGDKKELTPDQVRFQRTHPHNWHRVNSDAEAIELCKLIRSLVTR